MNARRTGGSGSADNGSVEESWEKLTEQLTRIREDLTALNTAAGDLARAGAAEGREKVTAEIEELTRRVGALAKELDTHSHGAVRRASEQAGALGREFEGAINRNPMASVLIAAGVGLLIGLASRGRG